jgi:hypothetical protein
MKIDRVHFIKVCFYIGVVADLLATVPLVFPEAARLMFGLGQVSVGDDYLYASRIGASLMAGWTLLLLWGSFRPIERKEVLLLTLVPVLIGLLVSSILVVSSGFVKAQYMVPLWIFYAIIIPLYIRAYLLARKLSAEV